MKCLLRELPVESRLFIVKAREVRPMQDSNEWWAPYNHVIPQGYLRFIRAEQAALSMSMFHSVAIPGVLQTESYATRVTGQFSPVLSSLHIRDKIKLRMERQWRLFERVPPPRIRVLLDESVLVRMVGDAQIQCEQLTHLIRLVEDRRVVLQVLPLREGAIWPVLGCLPFVLFETAESSLLSMENSTDHINSDNQFEVSHFFAAFNNLCGQSLSPEDSLRHIKQLLLHPESTFINDRYYGAPRS